MRVQYNSDMIISLVCSIWVGNTSDHGIIGTASQENLEGLQLGGNAR
jgi:hypothetical protein